MLIDNQILSSYYLKMSLSKSIFLVLVAYSLSCASASKVNKDPREIKAPFDGVQFQNIEPFDDKSFFKVFWWQIKALFYRESWPEKVPQRLYEPQIQRSEDLKVIVVNHATVLIQMSGINILTDPQYSERASPVSWAGPKRVRPPAIPFDKLPPIDAVVISHDHYDHLDIPTLKRLFKAHSPKVFVGLGNKKLLQKNGINSVIEMDWWDEVFMGNVKIHFVPVQHWSARGTSDKRETLWGGFVLEGSQKVFFAGDTGYGKVFKLA